MEINKNRIKKIWKDIFAETAASKMNPLPEFTLPLSIEFKSSNLRARQEWQKEESETAHQGSLEESPWSSSV